MKIRTVCSTFRHMGKTRQKRRAAARASRTVVEPLNAPPNLRASGSCIFGMKHRLEIVDRWLVCARCGLLPAKDARSKHGRLRASLIETFGDQCWYCGIRFARFEGVYTIDHWWPKDRKGADKPRNMRPACEDCNSKKDNMKPRRFERLDWLRLRREWVFLTYGDVPVRFQEGSMFYNDN